MGPNALDEQEWARTPAGKIILRLIEEWETGVTEHGDIVLGLTSTLGNDPGPAPGEQLRAQFICTRDDARQIAHMILRAAAFSERDGASDFPAFCGRIQSPALRALAEDWNRARGKRRLPSWDDINLGITAPYLPAMWAFDYDRVTEQFTGRLAGRNILLGFGKNFLGTPLRDLHPPHVFELAHASFARTLLEPACVRFSGDLFRMGNQIVRGERLILSIGDDPDQPQGVMGASWYENYPVARTPDHVEVIHDMADWCRL